MLVAQVLATAVIDGKEYKSSVEVDTDKENESVSKLNDLFRVVKRTVEIMRGDLM